MSEDNKLAESAEPSQTAQPADAAEPAGSAQSTDAAELVHSTEAAPSAEAAQPAESVQSADAVKPAVEPATEPSAEAAKPEKAERPARPERPAKAAATDEAPAVPVVSPNQPLLDQLIRILSTEVAEDAVTASLINEPNGHLPTVTIAAEHWASAALTLRDHPELRCNYLRNLSGVDQETHLEVVYHLISLTTRTNYCVRVTTDRETPSIPSVTSVWEGANWNEREVFDLLGIDFPGHPNMTRIMMADDWVGHPLRKDYEPLDPEV